MKTKSLTIIIVTLIIIFGIILLLIFPVASSIFSSWNSLSEAKNNLKNIEEKKQVLESLKNNKEIPRVAEIAENYITKDQDSGQLIIELTAMAETNNLKVEQTSLEKNKKTTDSVDKTDETKKASPSPAVSGAAKATDEASTVDFTMKITGSFVDFMNFLKSIETNSRLILIKNISMQTKQDQGSSTFDAQIGGSAYYKKDITLEPTLENIKVSDETMEAFLNLKTFGQPINLPGESGFGRPNPFENY